MTIIIYEEIIWITSLSCQERSGDETSAFDHLGRDACRGDEGRGGTGWNQCVTISKSSNFKMIHVFRPN